MKTPEIITKEDARNQGLKHYYTGKPCKRGHYDYKLVSNNCCCSCAREMSANWRKNNPERYKEIRRKSHYKNSDKEAEYAKEYGQRPEVKERVRTRAREAYQQDPEFFREKGRKFREENPQLEKSYRKKHYDLNKHRVMARNAVRRANERNATPAWFNKEEVYYIYELAREKGLAVDHIVPLVSDYVCGLHVQDNLRCVPYSLNARKGNHYWPDM